MKRRTYSIFAIARRHPRLFSNMLKLKPIFFFPEPEWS